MIRILVQSVPGGDEARTRELGRAVLANLSEAGSAPTHSDYGIYAEEVPIRSRIFPPGAAADWSPSRPQAIGLAAGREIGGLGRQPGGNRSFVRTPTAGIGERRNDEFP